jgi:hypothetical protein
MKKSIIFLLTFVLTSCQLNKTNNTETAVSTNTVPIITSIDARAITTKYLERDMGVDEFGRSKKYSYFKVDIVLKNKSSLAIKKILASVLFKPKNSDPDSRSAQNDTYNCEEEIVIMPSESKIVTYSVIPQDDINMVYSGTIIQRIIYSDGTYEDLSYLVVKL